MLPEKEKNYIQVNRLLNIKQTLLIFLLQRKEDKNMEFASAAMAGSRIVDWRTSRLQAQGPYTIYGAALAIGLIIPVTILLVRFLLNKKIETSADVYTATSLPVTGEIIFVKSPGMPAVWTDNYSPLAEQFRTLRTNVAYLNKSGNKKIFLVTSTVSGEGKSFISLNLARALAMVNKKVVLLEFDLRNPVCLNYLASGKRQVWQNYWLAMLLQNWWLRHWRIMQIFISLQQEMMRKVMPLKCS